MQFAVKMSRLAFVLLAIVVGVFIWYADNGVSNVVLSWLRGVRHGDKYAHFLVYGFLAFFLHLAMLGRCWRFWRLLIPIAPVVVLAFGLGEEVTQLFSPRRQFSWMDLACNLGGVVTFTLLAQISLWLLRRFEAGKVPA